MAREIAASSRKTAKSQVYFRQFGGGDPGATQTALAISIFKAGRRGKANVLERAFVAGGDGRLFSRRSAGRLNPPVDAVISA